MGLEQRAVAFEGLRLAAAVSDQLPERQVLIDYAMLHGHGSAVEGWSAMNGICVSRSAITGVLVDDRPGPDPAIASVRV